MDFETYKRANEKINVPPGLIQETMVKMREQKNDDKKPARIGRGWYVALATMCLMIAILTPVLLNITNPRIILTELDDSQITQQVDLVNGFLIFHDNGGNSLSPHFGYPDASAHNNEPKPSIAVTTARGSLPEQCDKALFMDSTISGTPLYVGARGSHSYFAQFMYEDIGYYIEGENITQAEFIKELYSILK